MWPKKNHCKTRINNFRLFDGEYTVSVFIQHYGKHNTSKNTYHTSHPAISVIWCDIKMSWTKKKQKKTSDRTVNGAKDTQHTRTSHTTHILSFVITLISYSFFTQRCCGWQSLSELKTTLNRHSRNMICKCTTRRLFSTLMAALCHLYEIGYSSCFCLLLFLMIVLYLFFFLDSSCSYVCVLCRMFSDSAPFIAIK